MIEVTFVLLITLAAHLIEADIHLRYNSQVEELEYASQKIYAKITGSNPVLTTNNKRQWEQKLE